MTLTDRQKSLRIYLADKGFASLDTLVARFGISLSTARRDLESLQKQGLVRRYRGGAVYTESHPARSDGRPQGARNGPEKAQIGAAIDGMIQDGDTVILAHGTTTFRVAKRLRGRPLQVLTNSLPIVNFLADDPSTELIFLGGFIMPRVGVALGPHTEDMLRSLNASVAVLGVGGLTMEGLFNNHLLVVDVHRAMMRSAGTVIVAADHSKFGRKSLARVCDLNEVDTLVTDSRADPSWVSRVRAAGIDVVTAPRTEENGNEMMAAQE